MGKGEGNDGGVIAIERSLLIKTSKADTASKDRARNLRTARWGKCCLSGDALTPPCVADNLGNVFNKVAVLELIVSKRVQPAFAHIRSMKRDVFPVTIATSVASDHDEVKLVCPLSGTESTGALPFVALRPCGCTMTERTLKAMTSAAMPKRADGAEATTTSGTTTLTFACPSCSAACTLDDIVRLYPTEEELSFMLERLTARRASAAAPKKAAESTTTPAAPADAAVPLPDVAHAGVKRAAPEGGHAAAVHDTRPATARPAARVASVPSHDTRSALVAEAAAVADASIAALRAKSTVYASIFSTGASAQTTAAQLRR